MSAAKALSLDAVVAPEEHPALEAAARLLETCLSAADGQAWEVRPRFHGTLDELKGAEGVVVAVTSLLGEVANCGQPWETAKARLQTSFADLALDGPPALFVCTVLRHAPPEDDAELALRRRVRIRRLNLLAAELSRELGLYVIDIDRDLADLGARRLNTDWRLQGLYGPEAAGKSIALAVVRLGLDDVLPLTSQVKAQEALLAVSLEMDVLAAPQPRLLLGGPLVSVQSGKRRQLVEMTTPPEAYAAFHIGRLLSGRIGLKSAAAIFFGAVRRTGLRASTLRLVKGVAAAVGSARRGGG